mmetsp:Transcript_4607/g.6350  ORF Transcript_4607/g.6350 Transcript_4607/m.6350 type:complete len:503 (-) Transcript_4607:218-1726(-)
MATNIRFFNATIIFISLLLKKSISFQSVVAHPHTSILKIQQPRFKSVQRGGGIPWLFKLKSSVEDAGFESEADYLAYLEDQGELPQGFQVGVTGFSFLPVELPTQEAKMKLTAIVLDEPTDAFAAVFTKNRFPGSPVLVGKERIDEQEIQAIIVNNKISNVCPGGNGVADSERICEEMAKEFGIASGKAVLPSSTGVIGWRLPVDSIVSALPELKESLQRGSMVPAASGICTTDRYPKLRGVEIPGGGRLVGIAKGAGMIEPNMATMLVYLVTDVAVPRENLREMLPRIVDQSFNCISVDSDESTSDTVALVSSKQVPLSGDSHLKAFEKCLTEICTDLAKEVVRNGEGTTHVMEVDVKGCWSKAAAKTIGKAVVNSPLFKCAVAGNDPNVGRLIAVVGKTIGRMEGVPEDFDCLNTSKFSVAGEVVFQGGQFDLNQDKEDRLYKTLKDTEMLGEIGEYLTFPPHFKVINIVVDLGCGEHCVRTWGSDLTAEYVSINADYRS